MGRAGPGLCHQDYLSAALVWTIISSPRGEEESFYDDKKFVYQRLNL